MIWIYVILGAVAGAIAAAAYTRITAKPGPTGCSSGADNSAKPQQESGCPLCSSAGANLLGGALIGAIAVLLIGIAVGGVNCPLSVCPIPSAAVPATPATPAMPGIVTPAIAPQTQSSVSVVTEPGNQVKPIEEKRQIKPAEPDEAPVAAKPQVPVESAPATKTAEEPAAAVNAPIDLAKEDPFAAPVETAIAKPEAEVKHYARPIKTADFDKETAKGLAIVDFWAEWCGPCQMQGPVFEALAKKYDGQVKFLKVNVDEEPGLGQRFSAEAIPALVVMRNGKMLAKREGYHDPEALEKLVLQLRDNPLPLLYPYVMRPE